ncbi:Rho termination factor N-terminal domain-containing protein [Clostridium tyrobutyricum]|uniref:Rho termination factor N-terminal domain-containing protein n=1 Tax=Clostridium tyrobutyricum TaxID=1519 RepID=UPI001C389E6A|nr:Rho termination factor N-terminal domain-containing protein [Clostridium tyrobutyricum]MBV4427151.1 Rho termination factor N-terminal domain-containing protein [Clostridium tyrobutyricum]MBV4442122.1 Rho termination factor N-terminal domain-containing protein [Clostridium tyrobutyricum]MBV4442307.1 Rho termination factor N-terminal domain-containing protein [Clostridium tyrobutyricum]MBV4450161.1 Rho termination factor N-terminal domain-containing protein [Clostridium tyrobutyricum]
MGLAAFNALRRKKALEKKLSKEKTIDYDKLTLDDLKQIARDKELTGYSNMKKDDLIAELKKLETEIEGEKK